MNPNSPQTEFTRKRYNTTSVIYDLMEWPVEQIWYRKWRRQLWNHVKGPKVLEIGVGTGKNIPFYPKGAHITGIDLSEGMLKRAKRTLENREKDRVTLHEMDAQQLGFPDDTFDEVVATFVYCSVPDPVLGLQEALRVTKPNGKLYLLEHMRSQNKHFASVMKTLDSPIHYLSGVHIARKTVENVEKAGWTIDMTNDLAAGDIFKMIAATKST